MLINIPSVTAELLKKEALVKSLENPTFFDFLGRLVSTYHQAPGVPCNYDSTQMRQSLGFSPSGQEDASEVLAKLFNPYKIDSLDITVSLKTNYQVKILIDGPSPKTLLSTEQHNALLWPLELPEGKSKESLEEVFTQSQKEYSVKTLRKFKYQNKKYKAPYQARLTMNPKKDNFLVYLKRFKVKNSKNLKNSIEIGVKKTYQFSNQNFGLSGFVVHLGATPNQGHYIAYCNTPTGWRRFDDERCSSLLDEADALKAAKDAYILHFKKTL